MIISLIKRGFDPPGRLRREVGVGLKMDAPKGLKIWSWFQIYRTRMSEMERCGWTVWDHSMPSFGRRRPEGSPSRDGHLACRRRRRRFRGIRGCERRRPLLWLAGVKINPVG